MERLSATDRFFLELRTEAEKIIDANYRYGENGLWVLESLPTELAERLLKIDETHRTYHPEMASVIDLSRYKKLRINENDPHLKTLITRRDALGRTLAHGLARNGQLFRSKEIKSIRDKSGRSVLHEMVKHMPPESFEKKDYLYVLSDDTGWTVLHEAALYGFRLPSKVFLNELSLEARGVTVAQLAASTNYENLLDYATQPHMTRLWKVDKLIRTVLKAPTEETISKMEETKESIQAHVRERISKRNKLTESFKQFVKSHFKLK